MFSSIGRWSRLPSRRRHSSPGVADRGATWQARAAAGGVGGAGLPAHRSLDASQLHCRIVRPRWVVFPKEVALRVGPGSLGLVLLATSSAGALAQSPSPGIPRDSQTVVFVCEHGTVKSVVALAYFRKLAQEHQLPVRAISRGTNPDSGVPAPVRDGLRADGLTLGPFVPRRFTSKDLASAVLVVSFDQPSVAAIVANRVPAVAWDGLPAVTADYDLAREAIRVRVAALVDSLSAAAGSRKRSRP